MLAIGHYDFGRNLKPVDFDGWCAADVLPPADTLDFWIIYWTRAYEYLSRHANRNLILFDYDAFCEDPESGLSVLGDCLGVVDCQRLRSFSGRIRRPSPLPVDSTGFSESCISEADAVLRRLRHSAVF